jgi:hypothetical protein
MLSFITCFDLKKDQIQKALFHNAILLERKIQDKVVLFCFCSYFCHLPCFNVRMSTCCL